MHLLDERGLVLFLGLRERVTQLDELGVEVLQLFGGRLRLTGEPRLDPPRMSASSPTILWPSDDRAASS
jgi:hypothetical protein